MAPDVLSEPVSRRNLTKNIAAAAVMVAAGSVTVVAAAPLPADVEIIRLCDEWLQLDKQLGDLEMVLDKETGEEYFDSRWVKIVDRQGLLFDRIVRKHAKTLRGAAMQMKVLELNDAITESHGRDINAHVVAIIRNARHLIEKEISNHAASTA
jgi:hypothetical protein